MGTAHSTKRKGQSGSRFFLLRFIIVDLIGFLGIDLEPCGEKAFNRKSVFRVGIGQILIVLMLGDIVFVGKEGPD